MRKVPEEKLKVELPPGFQLGEEEDFVYLFYKEREIAVFNSKAVDPKEIEKIAREHKG